MAGAITQSQNLVVESIELDQRIADGNTARDASDERPFALVDDQSLVEPDDAIEPAGDEELRSACHRRTIPRHAHPSVSIAFHPHPSSFKISAAARANVSETSRPSFALVSRYGTFVLFNRSSRAGIAS